jgi:hypothetical protein
MAESQIEEFWWYDSDYAKEYWDLGVDYVYKHLDPRDFDTWCIPHTLEICAVAEQAWAIREELA